MQAAGDGSDTRRGIISDSISDEEIFMSFLRDICGVEPTEDEISFFSEINKRTGDDEN